MTEQQDIPQYKEELSALKWLGKWSIYAVVFMAVAIVYFRRAEFFTNTGQFKWGFGLLMLLASIVVVALIYRYTVYIVKRYEYLLEYGLKVTARVFQRSIATYWNGRPVFLFQLEVRIENEAAYIATSKTMLIWERLSLFDVGNILEVRVNANDKNEVIIIHQYASPPIMNILGNIRKRKIKKIK